MKTKTETEIFSATLQTNIENPLPEQTVVEPEEQRQERFASFDDMSSPPTYLPPNPPTYLPPNPPAYIPLTVALVVEETSIDVPFHLNADTVVEKPIIPSLQPEVWTNKWEELTQASSSELGQKKRPPKSSRSNDSRSETGDSSNDSDNLVGSDNENKVKRALSEIVTGSGSSSSSSEDVSDAEPPSETKVKPWAHNSQPNPTNKSASATPRQNRIDSDSDTKSNSEDVSASDSDTKSESNSNSNSNSNSEDVSALTPLDLLRKNVAKLKDQQDRKDLYKKALNLYMALSALAQEIQDDSDHSISILDESDDEELSVHEYAFNINSILECDPNSPQYSQLIEDFNKSAQIAQGSPSRGWQIVGALMMALGAALVVLGSLALAGTLGLATPLAGGMIGAGVFSMGSGLTLFSINRRRGLSNAIVEFANSADNLIVEEEQLTDGHSM